MIYEAKYSGRAYFEALADAAEHADGGGCTGVRSDGSLCWPSAADIADCTVVRLSDDGDISEYRFDHARREVVFFYRGVRHGHKFKRLAGGYIWQQPILVLRYETKTPHWKWWETRGDFLPADFPAAFA
jgi:hypothetical protein